MERKRIVSTLILPLLLCSFLFSQSLAELAKKERERREKLKGEKSVVITNADLTKIKRKASVIVPQSLDKREDISKASSRERKSPPKKSPASRLMEADKRESYDAPSEIEDRWRKAKEYVQLLTLKTNALWQEFYSLDDATTQEAVQREIDEISKKLRKARQDEENIKKELENLRKK
jgi:hypothetical protein